MDRKKSVLLRRLNQLARSIPYKYRSWTPYQVSWSNGDYLLIYPRPEGTEARSQPIGKTARHALLRLLALKSYWGGDETKLTANERIAFEAELFAAPSREMLLGDLVGLLTVSSDQLRRWSGHVTDITAQVNAINLKVQRAFDAAAYRAAYARDVTNYVASVRNVGIQSWAARSEIWQGTAQIAAWCEEYEISLDKWLALFQQPDLSHNYTAQELTALYDKAGLRHKVEFDGTWFWKKHQEEDEETHTKQMELGFAIPNEPESFSSLGNAPYQAACQVLEEVNFALAVRELGYAPHWVAEWWKCEQSTWAKYLFDRLNEVQGPPVWEVLETLDELEDTLDFFHDIVESPYFAEQLWILVLSLQEITTW